MGCNSFCDSSVVSTSKQPAARAKAGQEGQPASSCSRAAAASPTPASTRQHGLTCTPPAMWPWAQHAASAAQRCCPGRRPAMSAEALDCMRPAVAPERRRQACPGAGDHAPAPQQRRRHRGPRARPHAAFAAGLGPSNRLSPAWSHHAVTRHSRRHVAAISGALARRGDRPELHLTSQPPEHLAAATDSPEAPAHRLGRGCPSKSCGLSSMASVEPVQELSFQDLPTLQLTDEELHATLPLGPAGQVLYGRLTNGLT